jgi:drug/metabolite transporter (DMT)-like permease
MALGTVIWYEGVERSKALRISVFMSVTPVAALIFSYLVLGEPFEVIHLLGIAIVIGAIWLFDHTK